MATVVVELTGDEAKLLRSMQKVIDQQAKLNAGFKDNSKNANSIQSAVDRGIGSLRTMALTAVSVDTAFQAIGTAQKSFIERMERSVELVRELAQAQQEASKNLAGTSQGNMSDILQKAVPQIAERANFSDLAKITTAIGSVSSIVGEQQAPSIVEAAANVTRFKKDDLQSTATATADIVKASGLKDGREAMSLLLTSGAVARPEELSKLATTASKAIYAGVNASPKQAPVEAAKESASLVAMMSKVDKNGESAATAAIQFIEQVRATFTPTTDEQIKRAEKLKELLDKQDVTEEERLRIERAKVTLQEKERDAAKFKPEDASVRAQSARLAVQEAKSNLVEVQKDSGLTTKEAEELRRLQIQASFAGKDPGTFRTRLEVIRKEPELMRDLETNLTGEAQFKPIVKGLFDPNSIHSKELAAAFDAVSTDVSKFDDALKAMTLTAQQVLANASEKVDTSIAVKQFKDIELQTMGTIDSTVKKALTENPLTGFDAFAEGMAKFTAARFNIDTESVSSSAANTEEAFKAGISALITRQVKIRGMSSFESLPETDKAKIASLDQAILTLQRTRREVEAVKNTQQPVEALQIIERKMEGQIVRPEAVAVVQPSAVAQPIQTPEAQRQQAAQAAPIQQDDSISILKAMLQKMEAMEKKQNDEIQARQLEVLQKIEAKSGPRPEARSNSLREQLAGPN